MIGRLIESRARSIFARGRTRVNAVTAISINCKKKDVEDISPRITGSPNVKLVGILRFYVSLHYQQFMVRCSVPVAR